MTLRKKKAPPPSFSSNFDKGCRASYFNISSHFSRLIGKCMVSTFQLSHKSPNKDPNKWIFNIAVMNVSALEPSWKWRVGTVLKCVHLPQIFIHMLPPYLCMLRPKVETSLALDAPPKREHKHAISKVADEYFIRKPDSSVLFPKPNRWGHTHWGQRSGVTHSLRGVYFAHTLYL